jgi:hypothetical protein
MKINNDNLIYFLTKHTAGAVSKATKTAGTKIEISSLRNMIETSGFFIVHTFAAAISGKKKVLKS